MRLFGHLLLLLWLFSTLSLALWEHICGKLIHQHVFQYMFQYVFQYVFPCDTSNTKCSSKLRFQLAVNSFCSEILSIEFCGMWFMWYLTGSLSFYELNQYYSLQINKFLGFFWFMQTVLGMQYCLSIENIHCLLWCYFCFLHLGVQNHNKDPAINCFGAAFCTRAFAQRTVLNYLSMSPSSLPPRRTFHLTCCWTGWSLSLSVSSLKHAPQLTRQSWSCRYSDQSLECAVVSSLYTCISFPRKPKYGGSGKRKVVLLLLNPHLGIESWILHVFCDHVSASPAFAVQLNKHDTNDMYFMLYKK